MYLYQKGLFRKFSVYFFCYSSKACTWYALICWVRLRLHFQLFCWLYFNTVDQKTTWLLQNAHTFQHVPIHQIKIYQFRASCFLFSSQLLDLQGPMLIFSYICFLWYYLGSQMISAIRTVIRLVCFSLQAALSKYENCDIWIPENVYCFFHLVLHITWGLETGRINIDLLLSVPCPCNTVNLDTISSNYSTFYLRF